MKKISIVTPSYNQGQFLEQTIDSVLSQNYPNLEYMVMDGGSTDNSVEIIKKYQKYLAYWVSETDNGQSHAINKGLSRISGEIFNWLNSDDYYMPDALHAVAECFSSDSVSVVSGKSNIWKNDKILLQSSGTDIHDILSKTIGGARIDQPETFFSISAVKRMGLLNERLHFVMDREWWIRYLLLFGQDGIKKTEQILVNFRIHEGSKTNNQPADFFQETLNVYYTVALHYQLGEADFFKSQLAASKMELFNFPELSDLSVVRQAIHYFWYFQGCMQYASNNYQLASLFFRPISKQYLMPQDVAEMEKIKLRMKILPVFIKKIWNRND